MLVDHIIMHRCKSDGLKHLVIFEGMAITDAYMNLWGFFVTEGIEVLGHHAFMF